VKQVGNVIERAVEHALRDKAKLEVVTGEAAAVLDSAGGIGAFLKTRTKAVVAG
jgi:peptide subunit release factor 1 (eRF1)